MRRLRILIVIGAMLSVAQVANAGPFDDGLTAYVHGDFATALKLLRPLAEQGNAWAEYYLGEIFDPLEEIHFKGRGVAPDFKEALKWYRLSAAQNNAAAQLCLGDMYHMGHGVTRDEVRAYMWWDLAASSSIEKIDSNIRRLHSKAIRKANSIIVKDMTTEQVDQAVRMERRCRKSNFKECN